MLWTSEETHLIMIFDIPYSSHRKTVKTQIGKYLYDTEYYKWKVYAIWALLD